MIRFGLKVLERKSVFNNELVIALDPGHGGEENGACYYGRKEKDLNYSLAKMLQMELQQYPNVKVILTRDEDETVDLQERARRAFEAKANLLISLHFNASVSHEASGATVYISTGEKNRNHLFVLSDHLLGQFEHLGLVNNGTIARTTQTGGRRKDGSFEDYYGILRQGYSYNIKAVLIEHCFMDCKRDQVFIKDVTGLDMLAKADANGVASFYHLKREDGTRPEERHAKIYGATTKAGSLNSFEPPKLLALRLKANQDGCVPYVTYEVEIQDENTIRSMYLIYKSENGESFLVELALGEGIGTGTHWVRGGIPKNISHTKYSLVYVGILNEAGFEAGYHVWNQNMIGFGKCEWLNQFPYCGEADLEW